MMSTESFVGIDVSKDTLELLIRPTAEFVSRPNNREGIGSILAQLLELRPVLVVVEATGGYERDLAIALAVAGLPLAVVNPRQVRDFAKALGQLAKTDRVDAGVIAHFAETIRPEPRGVPEAESRELEALITRRGQLIEMSTAEKNRAGTAARSMRAAIQEHVRWLEKQIKDLDRELARLIEASPVWRARDDLLKSAPSIGDCTARILIARLPELGHLSAKQIAALVGLAPFACDSGQYRGKRKIWGGRADVRSALYMATLSAIRCNAPIRAHFKQLEARGKLFKVAMVACMRKLLTILNTMVRNNQRWTPMPLPVRA
jgi:transposase